MTVRDHGSDFASMASATHIAPAPRRPEEIRAAQVNVAAACLTLWPGEAEEACAELLEMLGLAS